VLDFSGAVARLVAACGQGRLVDAVFMASALVDQTTARCGPDHPQVLDAMELLAHVAHLVGDQGRCVRLYVHVAGRRAWHYGVDHPGVSIPADADADADAGLGGVAGPVFEDSPARQLRITKSPG
jgi:hypothetical protein